VGQRLPALEGAYHRSGWAGVVDVTPDGRPILGLEGSEGLFLSVSWSGTGFKKAPALGTELARWVTAGVPRRDALSAYDLGRFESGVGFAVSMSTGRRRPTDVNRPFERRRVAGKALHPAPRAISSTKPRRRGCQKFGGNASRGTPSGPSDRYSGRRSV
jgi:FAD dependent oxidoreductase